MNRLEAITILNHHLDHLESVGYAALAGQIGENLVFKTRDDTGADYQLELSILWDHHPNGAIRIVGSIDDGGLCAFFPLTSSRLVEPKAGSISST